MQDMGMKIRIACTLAGVSVAELARRIGTSPQNLNQRLKVGRFSTEELERIAKALGAEFCLEFIFPDGSKA
jgi:transcriptional regulator with XRE-family HTH domain